jgi:RiboL-PSP-HEPN
VKRSQSWSSFLDHLRELTALIRSDPSSAYFGRAHGAGYSDAAITSALTKGCVLLLSGRLQGFVESIVAEFLEVLDGSRIAVDQIPESLRANLCRQYLRGNRRPSLADVASLHRRYSVLWHAGMVLPPGTLRTDTLTDEIWNPWPDRVQEIMRRCDVDLFDAVRAAQGPRYLRDLQDYVGLLVDHRNAVAHGDDLTPLSMRDVRVLIQWSVRLARSCDTVLGAQLARIVRPPGWV